MFRKLSYSAGYLPPLDKPHTVTPQRQWYHVKENNHSRRTKIVRCWSTNLKKKLSISEPSFEFTDWLWYFISMFLTWSYFDYYIFSDTNLSNILGDTLLQVCTWYSKLCGLAWPPFCPVLNAIKYTVQWVRVGHTCFLYWPLCSRARTDLFCNSHYEEAEKQWRRWEAVEHLFKSVFIVSKV